jgi:hypothetical protein
VISHASIRQRVIWTIISLTMLSFAFGMLLCIAIQRAMQQDFLYFWLWLLAGLPLLFAAIVTNTLRLLNALPRGPSS